MSKKHKEFADLLMELDILPAENHDLFLKELTVSRSINHNIDLLRLLNKTLIVDNENYPDEPEDYYPMVHREMTRIFSEEVFDCFQVHGEVDGKAYKRANYHHSNYKVNRLYGGIIHN